MTAGLSNESRALLERAKRQGGPTRAQTAKIGAAVLAATTASAATAAATTISGGGTAVAASSSLITVIGAGLVATAIGIGGTIAVKRAIAPPAPPPRVAIRTPPASASSVEPIVASPQIAQPPEPVPAPVVVEAPAPVATARPSERATAKPQVVAVESTPDVPELVRPIEPAPPAVVPHEQPPVDSTAAQVAALTAAVDALDRNQPEVARSTARAARLADRSGVLAPELMVVEITALCELGRRDEAVSLSREMTAAEQTPLVRGKLGRTCVGTGK